MPCKGIVKAGQKPASICSKLNTNAAELIVLLTGLLWHGKWWLQSRFDLLLLLFPLLLLLFSLLLLFLQWLGGLSSFSDMKSAKQFCHLKGLIRNNEFISILFHRLPSKILPYTDSPDLLMLSLKALYETSQVFMKILCRACFFYDFTEP